MGYLTGVWHNARQGTPAQHFALIFHLSVCLCDTLAWGYTAASGEMAAMGYHFGQWTCFLTEWGHFTQSIYFWLCVVTDILLLSDDPTARHHGVILMRHKDRLFTLDWALANVIGSVFWCVIFAHSPVYILEHGFFQEFLAHGVTWIAIWVEMFVGYHKYGSYVLEFVMMIAYASAYMGWTMVCHAQNNKWPYFFQNNLTQVQFWLLTGAIAVYMILLYLLGRAINHYYWRSRADYQGRGQDDINGGVMMLGGDMHPVSGRHEGYHHSKGVAHTGGVQYVYGTV